MDTPILLHHYVKGDYLHLPDKDTILDEYGVQEYETVRTVMCTLLGEYRKDLLRLFHENYPPEKCTIDLTTVKLQLLRNRPLALYIPTQPSLDKLRRQHDRFLVPIEYEYIGENFAEDLIQGIAIHAKTQLAAKLRSLGKMTKVLESTGKIPISCAVASSREWLVIEGKSYPNIFEGMKSIPFGTWKRTPDANTVTLECQDLFKIRLQ